MWEFSFPQLYWDTVDTLCRFKMYSVLIQYICKLQKMMATKGLPTTSIPSRGYHFFIVVRTFKISLSNFQVLDAMLLVIITLLYIHPQNLLIFLKKFCIFIFTSLYIFY